MIKNKIIKRLLIGTVFSGLSALNKLFPKDKNKILFYADARFADNLYYLYQYLIEKGGNKKYQIYCVAKNFENVDTNTKGVSFISPKKAIVHYLNSGHVFYYSGKIPIVPSRDQIVIQMWHGTSFKGFSEDQVKTNSLKRQFYTYVYASSDYFVPIVEKKFSVPRDRVYICGHPRTDVFYGGQKRYNISDNNDKVIIWLPTFRVSSRLGMVNGNKDTVLPVLDEKEMPVFNEFLREQHVKLIVKLHPSQDEQGGQFNYSNLIFMSHKEFTDKKMELYPLLSETDALITDYSSVFYDYLLLDKPIGFTEDDIDMYKDTRGFAVGDLDKFRPGMKIRTVEDLKQFVSDVVNGNDPYREQRSELNNLANKYKDGQNCARTIALSQIEL